MEQYTIASLVTLCTTLLITYLAFNVGKTRMKHKVPPYENTKKEEVNIAVRTHMNTIEAAVGFLPVLWIASIFGPTQFVGVLGILWFLVRVWYAVAYLAEPKTRQIPFMLSLLCFVVTVLLGIYGLIW